MVIKFTPDFGHLASSWSPGPHYLHNNFGVFADVQFRAKWPHKLHARHWTISGPFASYWIRLRHPLLLLALLLFCPHRLFLYPPDMAPALLMFSLPPNMEASCVRSTCWGPLVFILKGHSFVECLMIWQISQNWFFKQDLFVWPSVLHSMHHSSLPFVYFYMFLNSFIIQIMSFWRA